MARYIRKAPTPRASDFDDGRVLPPLGHPMVFEREPVRTGLVDKDGHDICRLPDEIGFLRRDRERP